MLFRRQGKYSRGENPKWTEVMVAVLTIGLLLVGFFQWRVYQRQLSEMQSGGEQNRELIKYADISSMAAAKTAEAAKSLAESANTSVNKLAELSRASLLGSALAQKEAEADRRAWVALESGEVVDFTANSNLVLHFDFHNFGRSPALKVAVGTVGFPVTFGLASDTLKMNQAIEQKLTDMKQMKEYQSPVPYGPIAPTAAFDYTLPEGFVLSTQLKNQIESNRGTVYFLIRIVYEDVQRIHRETISCYYLAMLQNKPALLLAPFDNEMN